MEENPFKLPEDKRPEFISAVAFFTVLLACLLHYIAEKPPTRESLSAERQKELKRMVDELTQDRKPHRIPRE